MNIRTQLRASTFATTFFLVLFIVILLIIASLVWQATDRLKVAEQITERSFQLSLLRSDYLQHPGERAKIQWIGQSQSKLRLIDEKAHLFTNDIERGLVEKLRMAAYSNRLMFAQLVRSVEQGGSDTVVQELSNQMSMRSQTGIQLAVQLSASSRQAVATAARMLVYAVFVIGLFVFIISLGTSVISRNISQTISALAKGTRTIAGGNLTYRLPEAGKNELGDLSRLFNTMSTELQRSYASLEERVQKRTSELQETSRFLDAILENIPNMIFVKDAEELRFVRFNRAAEHLLGFNREDMIGKNDYDFFPKDQAGFFIGKDRQALESATVTDIPEEPIDTAHHGKRWLHTRKISIRDENGKPQYLLGISEDITDGKRSTQDLEEARARERASFQRLRSIISLLSIGVLATDEHEIILETNRLFCDFFLPTLSPTDLVGRPGKDFTKQIISSITDDIDDYVRKMRPLLTNRTPVYGREVVLNDGRILLNDYIPVFDDGKFRGNILLYRDVTRERQDNNAKTEFVSLASHQLRTPLTEIRWALSSLKQEHLTREQKETVSTAHAASSHMAETIKAMLAISHVETGDMSPEPANVKLKDLIGDIARLTEAEMKEKNITLTVQCPPRLTMHTDAQLLKEVVGNLLSNACKYNRKGGAVTVTAAKEKDRIRIDVSDTGLGIPRGEQDRISEKFFRASNAIEHNQEGSGLGLHLAYSLVQLLGGTIAFSSDERTGTIFTLSFPASV